MRYVILMLLWSAAITSQLFSQNMFRGNPAHTGVYDSAGPRQFTAVKWAFKTQGWVMTSPAIANGLAYFGSDDKNIYAVDVSNGRQKWKYETGGAVRSSPAVVDGTLYAGSYDNNFYALDGATGKLKWKFEMAGERQFEARGLHGQFPRAQTISDFWDFFQSSPVVDPGKGIVYFGSGDGYLYAVDIQNGQLKWKFKTADVVHSSPALADGLVYFGSWDSYFYALDGATGQEKWKFKTGEDKTYYNQVGIQSSPSVVDGVVYFGCRDSHLYALDAKSGQLKWSFPNKNSWINTSPAIFGGVAYVGSPIPGIFRAIDIKTGELRFNLDARMIIFSSPAVAGDMAYFGAFNGKLYAVDLKSGKFAWEFQTPAGRRDQLGLTTPDGRLENPTPPPTGLYDETHRHWGGKVLATLGSILSSPTVHEGVIYFGSTDGYLYAIE